MGSEIWRAKRSSVDGYSGKGRRETTRRVESEWYFWSFQFHEYTRRWDEGVKCLAL